MNNQFAITMFNTLKLIASFAILFSVFYFILKLTVCKLFSFNNKTFIKVLYLDDFVSILGSLILIFTFIDF
jgi:hypothetical protein